MSETAYLIRALASNLGQVSTFAPLDNAYPLAGVRVGDGVALFVVPVQDGGGFGDTPLMLNDNQDNVAPITQNRYQAAVVRLTGYDGGADNWDRIRSVADTADGQALGVGHLATWAQVAAFNGGTYDRVRTNSASVLSGTTQPFAQAVAQPGEWAVNSEPAVSTQATASRAAGAAGVRHVCRSLHFSLNAVAAQANIYARVRDGASGAGTILWSQCVVAPAAGFVNIVLSGLNIIGSAATAMTFEFSAAPTATNFQTAGGSGYSTI